MAFTTGTATFTQGTKQVTVSNLAAGNLGFITSGTALVVGNDPIVGIVECVTASSNPLTITLLNNWPHATGSQPFVVLNSSEKVRDAVVRMEEATALLTQTQSESWTTQNTTVDSNGFIKQASPIVKLYANAAVGNDEVESLSFTRLAEGAYIVHTTQGFAKKGWYIETPKDANGRPKVLVDYEQKSNGDIHVQTYVFNPQFELKERTDIPEGRWIDLRLQPKR